jgi:hypothetical protein
MNDIASAIIHESKIGLKAQAVVCVLSTMISIVAISFLPEKGYEISIYSSTPYFVWSLLFLSSVIGITILVRESFDQKKKSNFYLLGLFIIALNNFIFISLSALRGYLYYASSDTIYHLKEAQSIMLNGYISSTNFYPFLHLIYSIIAEITMLQPLEISRYLPAYIYIIFYMLFTFTLALNIMNKSFAILAWIATSPMLFNNLSVQLYPQSLSVLLFPMIFYLYIKIIKNRQWNFSILFISVLLIFPFTHPASSLAMIFILLAIETARAAYSLRYKGHFSLSSISINPIICSSIVFFLWLSNFKLISQGLANIEEQIFNPKGNQFIISASGTLSELNIIEIIKYNFLMYGDTIIIMVLSVLAIIEIFRKYYRGIKLNEYVYLFSIIFITSLLLSFFFFMGTHSETIGRLLNLSYMIIPATILVSYYTYIHLTKINWITPLALFFSLITILSVLSLYQSPLTYSASFQLTRMDLAGSNWFLKYNNSDLNFDSTSIENFLLNGKPQLLPKDFYYISQLRNSITQDSYLLINKRCRQMNQDHMISKIQLNFASGWGLDRNFFSQFKIDSSVANIYSNGEFDTYLIK